jgi:hypothetical protein
MKNRFIKLLFLILISFSISTCKKEDLTGNINITFENHPGDLEIDIYMLENTQIALFSNLKPDSHGSFTKALNPDNYYFVPSAASIYPNTFSPIACQIQPGGNTTVYYDHYNVARLRSGK